MFMGKSYGALHFCLLLCFSSLLAPLPGFLILPGLEQGSREGAKCTGYKRAYVTSTDMTGLRVLWSQEMSDAQLLIDFLPHLLPFRGPLNQTSQECKYLRWLLVSIMPLHLYLIVYFQSLSLLCLPCLPRSFFWGSFSYKAHREHLHIFSFNRIWEHRPFTKQSLFLFPNLSHVLSFPLPSNSPTTI